MSFFCMVSDVVGFGVLHVYLLLFQKIFIVDVVLIAYYIVVSVEGLFVIVLFLELLHHPLYCVSRRFLFMIVGIYHVVVVL